MSYFGLDILSRAITSARTSPQRVTSRIPACLVAMLMLGTASTFADDTIRYGETISLVTTASDGREFWMTGNGQHWLEEQGARFSRVVTNSNRTTHVAYNWTIHSTRSRTADPKKGDPVKYGDTVYLADKSKWLVGNRAPFGNLVSLGIMNVYTCDPQTPGEKERNAVYYGWRIQPRPDSSKSNSGWAQFVGTQIKHGDPVALGCRYADNSLTPTFDGYTMLCGGRGPGNIEVYVNLHRSGTEQRYPNYTWKIIQSDQRYRTAEFLAWLKQDNPNPSPGLAKAIEEGGRTGRAGATEHAACEDHARRGYNVLRMNALDFQDHYGVGDYILKKHFDNAGTRYVDQGWIVPKDMFVQTQVNSKQFTIDRVFFSENSLIDSLSLSASVKGGVGAKGAKVSRNVEMGFSKTRTRSSTNKQAYGYNRSMSYRLWLTLNKDRLQLSDSLSRFTQRDLQPDSRDAWFRLFNRFGTHYALSTLYGAQATKKETFDAQTVCDKLATVYSGGTQAEGSIKGISVGNAFSFEKSKTTSSKQSSESSASQSSSAGNLADAKELVPLRLDLRPIYDLFWPEMASNVSMSKATFEHYRKLREKGPEMLRQYKQQMAAVPNGGRGKPKLFELTYMETELVINDDNGSEAEVGGSVLFSVTMPQDLGTNLGVKGTKELRWGSIAAYTDMAPGSKAGVKQSQLFTVFPTQPGGQTYDLSQVNITLDSGYVEDDNDSDDYFRTGANSWNLAYLLQAMNNPTNRLYAEFTGDGAGTLRVYFKVEEVGLESKGLSYPSYPGERTWRTPPRG